MKMTTIKIILYITAIITSMTLDKPWMITLQASLCGMALGATLVKLSHKSARNVHE